MILPGLVAIALAVANPFQLPALKDITGELSIGSTTCGFDGRVSAPLVCRGNRPIGPYLDDSTPGLNYWITKAQKLWGYVLVSRPPGKWNCPWSGVRCAHEVYRDCHYKPIQMRPAVRYILQYRYAPNRCLPPTQKQTVSLVLQAMQYKPSSIWVY